MADFNNGASAQSKVPPTCKSKTGWDTWTYYFNKWIALNLKKPADGAVAEKIDSYNDAYELYILQSVPATSPFHDVIEKDVMRLSKKGKKGQALLAALHELYTAEGDDMSRAKALGALESFRRGSLPLWDSIQQLIVLQQEAENAGCDFGTDHGFRYIANAAGETDLRKAMEGLEEGSKGAARNEALVTALKKTGHQQKATEALLESMGGAINNSKQQIRRPSNPDYSGAAQHQHNRSGSKHQHGLIDGSGRHGPRQCVFCSETHIPGRPNCPAATNKETCEKCGKVGSHRTACCEQVRRMLSNRRNFNQRGRGGRRTEAANGAVGNYPNDCCSESDF